MPHSFPRDTHTLPPRIARGEGVYLIDSDNNRYLDGSGGAAVSSLGHSNAAVRAAITKQLEQVAYAHTGFFTSAPAEELAGTLAQRAPGTIRHAYFCSGGSEAMESALKLARQYHMERGAAQRQHIISRWQSYHGNTLGALTIGGNQPRRQLYTPLLFANVHHISPCHYWRKAQVGESEAAYGKRTAMELEETILKLGAENVAAFVAETVVGATMGAVAAAAGYFRTIREICDRHGVLLILDEVMCGSGRCGTFFACEAEQIAPDIVCLAKGLSGGVLPLGAMLCSEEIYHTIDANSGVFRNGHTYHAHSTACAAALAVVQEMDAQALLPRVQQQGEALRRSLQQALGAHAHIGDIRGRGLFIGVEFVRDRSDNAPFPAGEMVYKKIAREAFARGLMVYGMGGTIDGTQGDHILLAPPYIIEDAHIAELTEKLHAAVCAVLGSGS